MRIDCDPLLIDLPKKASPARSEHLNILSFLYFDILLQTSAMPQLFRLLINKSSLDRRLAENREVQFNFYFEGELDK